MEILEQSVAQSYCSTHIGYYPSSLDIPAPSTEYNLTTSLSDNGVAAAALNQSFRGLKITLDYPKPIISEIKNYT